MSVLCLLLLTSFSENIRVRHDRSSCLPGPGHTRVPATPRRVPQYGVDDDVPGRRGQLVARVLKGEEVGAGNLLLQRERVAEGKHGVLGAVNHERRGADLVEPVAERIADVHGKVVHLARRDVDGAIYVPTHESAHGGFVEMARTARKHTQQTDDVVDHGLPIRPVRTPHSADVDKEYLRHGRKVGTTGARPDQGE